MWSNYSSYRRHNICRVKKCHAGTLHCLASLATFNLSASPFFKHSQESLHKNRASLSTTHQLAYIHVFFRNLESLAPRTDVWNKSIPVTIPSSQNCLASLIGCHIILTMEWTISKVMEEDWRKNKNDVKLWAWEKFPQKM